MRDPSDDSLTLNDKILDKSELKAFPDNKINVTQKLKFVLWTIENIVGKEENAGFQHFLHFAQCFQKVYPWGFKSRDCVVKSSSSKVSEN